MKLAIDIDSTLHPYWDQLEEVSTRIFGVALPYENQHTWGIAALEPEQLKQCIVETHSEELVMAAEPYEGAVEAIARWHAQGHFVHITSHRSTDAHDHTVRWLDGIGLPHDELYCSYDKITRCVEIGIDILIDDSPVNLSRARERGILGATIAHPWNREVREEGGIVSGGDWRELATALDPILDGRMTADG